MRKYGPQNPWLTVQPQFDARERQGRGDLRDAGSQLRLGPKEWVGEKYLPNAPPSKGPLGVTMLGNTVLLKD